MAKEVPEPEEKRLRKEKKERKAKKRAETDGVHKSSSSSKKDKSDRKEKKSKKEKSDKTAQSPTPNTTALAPEPILAEEAQDVDMTTSLLNTLQEEKPGTLVVKDEKGDLEIKIKQKPLIGALVPFANPLADEKVGKKVLKSVKKGI
ncbi:MAG: hypothetical protein L6R37_003060 [Teloschistes peruensis]|nr:MAG: hypothetical protein L6R37_003060 [Teloschistes peruensis]